MCIKDAYVFALTEHTYSFVRWMHIAQLWEGSLLFGICQLKLVSQTPFTFSLLNLF